MKMAVLKNVQDRLRNSVYSGTAKNLRAPYFGEKLENFGWTGQFGEWMRGNLLSIYNNVMADNVYDTAIPQK
jgi:hypothetical protein